MDTHYLVTEYGALTAPAFPVLSANHLWLDGHRVVDH